MASLRLPSTTVARIRSQHGGASNRLFSLLHSELLQHGTAKEGSNKHMVFLHGLLGNGRNLKTLATKASAQTGHTGVLLDLRGHGKSFQKQTWQEPHTFDACVKDVQTSLQTTPHDTLVGHSWGGRVALQYAATSGASLDRLWLLDTVPGQAHESVERVLEAVYKLQQDPPADRKQVVTLLTQEHGIDKATAQWLASSYNAKTGDFGFDLNVVQGLWPEFQTQDFFGLVEKCIQAGTRVDLVRGGKNPGWTVEILRELNALQGPNFAVHVLPKAGHWVHVDGLPELLEIMKN
jgi:esterase